ncbi:MAG: hypothetical protein N2112_01865 [Gemmataceae bacterium]|jgi:hypothetical protein|nr:hypothetical protein [Gemmataceae bacterium]
MKNRYWLSIVAILGFTLSAWAAPEPKGEAKPDNLKLLPDNAVVVLQMNGFGRVKERLGKMLAEAAPDKAQEITGLLNSGLEAALGGRDLKPISGTGHLYVAITDFEKITSGGGAVLVMPGDYNDFKKKVLTDEEQKTLKKDEETGAEVYDLSGGIIKSYLIDRKGTIILTSEADLAKKYAKGENGGLEKILTKEQIENFISQDLSIFVNLKEINKRYGDDIKGFKALVGPLLDGLEMGDAQGVSKSQIAAMKGLVDLIFQILEDGNSSIFSIDFRPEGLTLKAIANFGAETSSNKFLKAIKPESFPELDKLPSGHTFYSIEKLDIRGTKAGALLGAFSDITDEDEKVAKTLEELNKKLAELNPGIAISISDAMGTNGLDIVISKDADKFLDTNVKIFKASTNKSQYGGTPIKAAPKITPDAEKQGNLKFTRVEILLDFDKALIDVEDNLKPIIKKTLERAYGAEGKINLWLGSDGTNFMTVKAKDWTAAKKLIDEYTSNKNPLSSDTAFKETRKNLAQNANMISLFETAKTIYGLYTFGRDLFQGIGGAIPGLPPVALPELKAPEGKATYIGLSVSLKPETAEITIFVPASGFKEARKLLAPLIDRDN